MTPSRPEDLRKTAEWERDKGDDVDSAACHLYAIMFDDLNICGCGSPADAYDLVKQLLALAPLYEPGRVEEMRALIGSPGAVHLVLSALDEAGLMIHSSMIEWAGLTDKGRYALAAMQAVTWEQVDEVGYPHDGDACTDECWRLP